MACRKKTKGARRLEDVVSDEDIPTILYQFMSAIKKHGQFPPDGDKETTSKWSEARSAAMALQEKDVPIYNEAELNAVITMKHSYGFDGRIVLDRDFLGDK
ncbi:hypothetical protein MIMGU_mgv1a016947mg [Erythranthe guttata]|uniref:Uncharacterized protein n=1 Tax=Erythranthe guttata TaxID=4155 RepID=A0A022RW27_ERYGU|nr:hypothetical protein MIMGU_mgv1a016947mg [Erythranthe guttata]